MRHNRNHINLKDLWKCHFLKSFPFKKCAVHFFEVIINVNFYKSCWFSLKICRWNYLRILIFWKIRSLKILKIRWRLNNFWLLVAENHALFWTGKLLFVQLKTISSYKIGIAGLFYRKKIELDLLDENWSRHKIIKSKK